MSSFSSTLEQATNTHDVEQVVACFAPDYVNETPLHPARGFSGTEQVRRNWAQIFSAVPDLQARVIDSIAAGDRVWSEWEMSGTRVDGGHHLMRGVIVFTVRDDLATAARFYLESVDADGMDADEAVRRTLRR
jgi:ketosteroid isomerase-like protein